MRLPIRQATVHDLDVLYEVCLQTGDAGRDASDLFDDPTLLGSVYVGPYVSLDEGIGFVPLDDHGIGGYVLATADTRAFEAAAERAWWPLLRERHARVHTSPSKPDDVLVAHIHHPLPAPEELVARYPAHAHLDLFPRLQGHGVGVMLMTHILEWLRGRGASGVHLDVNPANERAIGFYGHLGFVPVPTADERFYMGLLLDR